MGIRLQLFAVDRAPALEFLNQPLAEVAWYCVENGSARLPGSWLDVGYSLKPGRGVLQSKGKSGLWLDHESRGNAPEFAGSAKSYLQTRSPYHLLFLLRELSTCPETPWVRTVIGPGYRRWWTASILEALADRYTFYQEERQLVEQLFAKMCRSYGIRGGYGTCADPGLAADSPLQIDCPDMPLNYFNSGEVTNLLTFLELLVSETPPITFRCPEALTNQDWDGWHDWVQEMIASMRAIESFGFREPCLFSFIG